MFTQYGVIKSVSRAILNLRDWYFVAPHYTEADLSGGVNSSFFRTLSNTAVTVLF